MDIIVSDALKNTKWGHMVKTKTKGYLSHTHDIKFPPSLIYSRNDNLLNHLNFPRSKHTLTLQQISLA